MHRFALLLVLLVAPVRAQEPVTVRPAGIDGALVIVGGGRLPDAIAARFLELAGGKSARLVLIPTASENADTEATDVGSWTTRGAASVTVLHTRERKKANDPLFIAPLRQATGVWFGGGSQSRLAEAYLGTAVEKELHALLKRGGVVGGTSAGAAIQSRVMIARGNPVAEVAQGLDLLPGAVVDQHFRQRSRQPRLAGVLEKHPGLVGFGVDEATALVVRGRELRVVGEGSVTVLLGKSAVRGPRTLELKPGDVHDLTALRRAAVARAATPFPPATCPTPEVPQGALVIVGGGGMPEAVTRRFIDLAGGPEALLVVLPTAVPDPIPPRSGATMFEKLGARNVKVLTARERRDVEAPESLELLAKAGGVWFGGGRQWRFVDAYENTRLHDALRGVLKRGGVLGGSSAGATILGDYLCRGSPLGNTEMMCEGYERGLGFLPGAAIDQHFAQRNRFGDMAALMTTFPQLVGVGIDEATALVVRGHSGEVLGRGAVHVYAGARTAGERVTVPAGGRYDFKERKASPK